MEPGMKCLYFSDRLVVMLSWTMLMIGVTADGFGGLSLYFGIFIVTWRVSGRVVPSSEVDPEL